jgi:hypothetical protein
LPTISRRSPVSTVAVISGLYDTVAGALLLFGAGHLHTLFGVPQSDPRIFTELNALFLIAIGVGYYMPWREPHGFRGYMWIMGVGLKSAGAAAFLADYVLHGSPAMLLFAASDAAVAAITLAALVKTARKATI